MDRNDSLIISCAKRMINKLHASPYYRADGEFHPSVKDELKRMRNLCGGKIVEKTLDSTVEFG